jgi:hypothetical protein
MIDEATPQENASHPFDLVVQALLRVGSRMRFEGSDRVRATCPSHQDSRPSLVVTRQGDRVLLKCFGGCRFEQVIAALGLKKFDLFIARVPHRRGRSPVVATYDYPRDDGSVAQKGRTEDKTFFWRSTNPERPERWRGGLGDRGLPGPYRLEDLRGAAIIWIVEGEKGVERLRAAGLISTCGSGGAATWRQEWSEALLRVAPADAEFVILPDNDKAGHRHAERIALDLHSVDPEHRRQVKVLNLPGLSQGGDVVDWLTGAHDVGKMSALAAETPIWSPELRAQLAAQRKREQAAERMRRHRAERKNNNGRSTGASQGERNTAISRVVETVSTHGPCSGRCVKRLLAGTVSRARIDAALAEAVRLGQLTRTPARFPKGYVYCVPAIAHGGVTTPEALASSVSGGTIQITVVTANIQSASQCAATLFQVTRREHTSRTLQEGSYRDRHSDATECSPLPSSQSTHKNRNPEEPRRPLACVEPWNAPDTGSPAHQDAIASQRCCGTSGSLLRCQLCRWSSTYSAALRQDCLPSPTTESNMVNKAVR